MEKNRADFYNRIKDKTKVEGDATSGLIMASNKTGQQQNFDYWQAQFFGGEEPARRTFANLQKVVGQPNNWFDRLLTTNPPGSINHKDFLKDEKSFFKAYCCDLPYLNLLPVCMGGGTNPNQQIDLNEYAGFYTGKDEKGKEQKQEIKASGTNLVTSVEHELAGRLDITLTPTTTKDVFNIDIKNSLIKSSSGTATFGRNKEGKVCNVTVNAKAKPTVGKEQTLSSVALKDGVSCDGANVTPSNDQPQPNNNQPTPTPQIQGGFPPCAGPYGKAVNVFLIVDKKTNAVVKFFHNKDEKAAEAEADKFLTDNTGKEYEKRKEMGKMMIINADFNNPYEDPRDRKFIVLKDKTFVSNSDNVHFGTYDCTTRSDGMPSIRITNTINEEEHKAKQTLKEYFIRLTK